MENKSFLRNTIGEYMLNLGDLNDKVTLVNADLSGTCRNKSFVQKYPERAFNVGIAEQNMVSFAAGLAHEGFIPYAFSMAPFLTMRACEQCRTDVAYAKLNVRLIGVYAGVSGGISGATHWAIEDCGIMTSMPGMLVMEVSDANMAKSMLDYSLDFKGPMYIRCTVEPTLNVYQEKAEIKSGGSHTLTEGGDGAILCSGVIVQYAIAAARELSDKYGINIRVVDMYSIKPIDRQAVIKAAETGLVLVAQDHNIIGGLGSMVSLVMAEEGLASKFKILGINDSFEPMAHPAYLYKKFGLDTAGLVKAVREMQMK